MTVWYYPSQAFEQTSPWPMHCLRFRCLTRQTEMSSLQPSSHFKLSRLSTSLSVLKHWTEQVVWESMHVGKSKVSTMQPPKSTAQFCWQAPIERSGFDSLGTGMVYWDANGTPLRQSSAHRASSWAHLKGLKYWIMHLAESMPQFFWQISMGPVTLGACSGY